MLKNCACYNFIIQNDLTTNEYPKILTHWTAFTAGKPVCFIFSFIDRTNEYPKILTHWTAFAAGKTVCFIVCFIPAPANGRSISA